MKPRYEYVPDHEWRPVKERLNSLLRQLQSLVFEELNVRISYKFVGSSNRDGGNFITRIRGGNKGYDFDVDLFVEPPSSGGYWTADSIRLGILDCCKSVFKKAGYQFPEDRTSVVRVKFLDERNRNILHSCDLAAFQDLGDEKGLRYCRKYDDGSYGWVLRGGHSKDAERKLSWLKKYVSHWYELLREEYLILKNVNQDESKASFQLFNEAIANVYNQVHQTLRQ